MYPQQQYQDMYQQYQQSKHFQMHRSPYEHVSLTMNQFQIPLCDLTCVAPREHRKHSWGLGHEVAEFLKCQRDEVLKRGGMHGRGKIEGTMMKMMICTTTSAAP